eukprot:28824-Eustigmatos_ZCMA.PRE.1
MHRYRQEKPVPSAIKSVLLSALSFDDSTYHECHRDACSPRPAPHKQRGVPHHDPPMLETLLPS